MHTATSLLSRPAKLSARLTRALRHGRGGGAPPADLALRDLLLVHGLLRREFAVLPLVIRAVADGDRRSARRVAAHAGLMVDLLAQHHRREDQLVWPLLQQGTHVDHVVVLRLAAQREALDRWLENLRAPLQQWSADVGIRQGQLLATEFRKAHSVLVEHVDDEERHVLPLVRQHLRLTATAGAASAGDTALCRSRVEAWVVGAVLEDADEVGRSQLLASIPRWRRFAWRTVGLRIHRQRTSRLRRDIAEPGRPA